MADYTYRQANHSYPDHGGVAKGNTSTYVLDIEADSSGILVDAGAEAALAAGDVIKRFHIPENFTVTDMQVVVTTAAGQVATFSVGFRYVDGVDVAEYPEGDDFYFASVALDAAARIRLSTAKRAVPFTKPAHLVLVAAGATLASALKMQLIVGGIHDGS